MQTKTPNKGNARKKLAIEWNQLRARLFQGPAGKADERFFKNEIAGWIGEPWSSKKRTWAQLLFDIIAMRNHDPHKLKYCYYNRTHQRALPTKDFETWAASTCRQLKKVLTQIHGA